MNSAEQAGRWLGLVFLQLLLGALFYRYGAVAARWVGTRRPGRRLWGLDPGLVTTIVLTTGALYDDAEHTETVYPAEARAAAEVEEYLRVIYPKMELRMVTSAAAGAEHIARGNIISIGGPVHNAVTRRLLSDVESDAEFDGFDLVLPSGRFSTRFDSGVITRDVALVVIAPNPHNRNGTSVVIAGCRTYGCLVGARALVRSDVHRTLREIGDARPAVFAVAGRVLNGDVSTVEVAR